MFFNPLPTLVTPITPWKYPKFLFLLTTSLPLCGNILWVFVDDHIWASFSSWHVQKDQFLNHLFKNQSWKGELCQTFNSFKLHANIWHVSIQNYISQENSVWLCVHFGSSVNQKKLSNHKMIQNNVVITLQEWQSYIQNLLLFLHIAGAPASTLITVSALIERNSRIERQ